MSLKTRFLNNVLFLAVALVFTACASAPEPEMTPLQIQAFQTQDFEASKKDVFASVVSVFQDLGYIVESADLDTGFITAASAASDKTGFWEAMGGVTAHGKTRATAFVDELRPDFVKVRINFVDTENRSSAYGSSTSKDTPIVNPEPYKIAFDKIADTVFVRQATK